MKKIITLAMLFLCSLITYSQEVIGDWKGTVNFQGKSLDFAFHLSKNTDTLTATMDIPSQGLMAGKAETASFENDTLTISFPTFGIIYKGKLENTIIKGNIIQNNFPVPLDIVRGEILLNRPQEPKAPYNYISEEIRFYNKGDNILLAGTLTLPKNIKSPPIAVIISGSGPQNRNGDMFGHALYHVLADYLTKKGIGVLRYDERGVGGSTGTFETSGIPEFSRDAIAAITFLKKRKDLKKSKIGFIGHSIGGIIAPQIASQNKDIDFTVMLAGPGVNGDALMLSQKAAIEKLMGVPEEQISQGQNVMGAAYNVITTTKETGKDLKDVVTAVLIEKLGPLVPIQQIEGITNQITTPEILSLLRTNPSSYLSKIETPILVLNGTLDFQVPYEENLRAINAEFAKGSNKNTTAEALESLNHLFQESTTGSVSEYSEIEQTISPKALERIVTWIKENTKK